MKKIKIFFENFDEIETEAENIKVVSSANNAGEHNIIAFFACVPNIKRLQYRNISHIEIDGETYVVPYECEKEGALVGTPEFQNKNENTFITDENKLVISIFG